MYVNQFVCVGRIASDLELKETENGTPYLFFTFVMNHFKIIRDYHPVLERSIWVQARSFGKVAKHIATYTKKGSLISIHGQLDQDQINLKHYLLVKSVAFMDRRYSPKPVGDREEGDDRIVSCKTD